MTRIHAGAVLERAPGPKYVEALDFAEIDIVGPRPRPSTLRRWADGLPEHFSLSLVVPKPAIHSARGPLRFDDDMRAAFDWTMEAAAAVRARFAVLATGREVTTGQRDRDLLARWVEEWTADTALVWQAAGLWDAEIAQPFARKLGVIQAFDPLEAVPPAGASIAYGRMRAIGMRNRFGETELLTVLDAFADADADEGFVAINSPKSFDEARRLALLAAAELADADPDADDDPEAT